MYEIEDAHFAIFPSLGPAINLNPDFVECHEREYRCSSLKGRS